MVLWARIRVEITETGIERSGGGLTTTIPWADVRRVGWSTDSSLLIVICVEGSPGSMPLFRVTTRLLRGPTNAERVDAVIEAIAEQIPGSGAGAIEVRTVAGIRGEDETDSGCTAGGEHRDLRRLRSSADRYGAQLELAELPRSRPGAKCLMGIDQSF